MNKMREIRRSRCMSQWSLAQNSKVHQSRISLAENGLIDLTGEEKKRLADVLGVTVNEAFGDEEPAITPLKGAGGQKAVSIQK